jgi:hypothetical protein
VIASSKVQCCTFNLKQWQIARCASRRP